MNVAMLAERPVFDGANDNQRSHVNTIENRLINCRLFPSFEENMSGLGAFKRFDTLLADAESENLYPRWMEGSIDPEDYAGQSVSAEVQGRSAEKTVEDYFNGPLAMHPKRPGVPVGGANSDCVGCITAQSGRFKFNTDGIICGYRLNKGPLHGDDIWVDRDSRSFPGNVVTPRERRASKGRNAPGKTRLSGTTGGDNDNFAARSQIEWLKARMSPEHYDAAYDVTAGHGFNEVGRTAGFTGKPADAVGKDRIMAGIRALIRLFTEWDQKGAPKPGS